MSPPAETRSDRFRRQAVAHLERLQSEGVWGLDLAVAKESSSTDEPHISGVGSSQKEGEVPPLALDDQAEPFGGGGGGQGGGRPVDETLEQIEAEALECVACRLHKGRNKVVFGVGHPKARLLFIGEGPGRDEDLQGEPFVGRAGKLLTKIIVAMGYERKDVYIANVVKCRPPQNRNPQADEAGACEHFLLRQVAVIQPDIIVLLGKVAVQAILGTSAPMSRLRGNFQTWCGIPVMCTYHPAYLLRNPAAKKDVWEDMQIVRDALAESGRP